MAIEENITDIRDITISDIYNVQTDKYRRNQHQTLFVKRMYVTKSHVTMSSFSLVQTTGEAHYNLLLATGNIKIFSTNHQGNFAIRLRIFTPIEAGAGCEQVLLCNLLYFVFCRFQGLSSIKPRPDAELGSIMIRN